MHFSFDLGVCQYLRHPGKSLHARSRRVGDSAHAARVVDWDDLRGLGALDTVRRERAFCCRFWTVV